MSPKLRDMTPSIITLLHVTQLLTTLVAFVNIGLFVNAEVTLSKVIEDSSYRWESSGIFFLFTSLLTLFIVALQLSFAFSKKLIVKVSKARRRMVSITISCIMSLQWIAAFSAFVQVLSSSRLRRENIRAYLQEKFTELRVNETLNEHPVSETEVTSRHSNHQRSQ
jgi:hypothetical protein